MKRLTRAVLGMLVAVGLLIGGLSAVADDASEITDVLEVDGGALIYTITDGIGAITGFQGSPTDVTIPFSVAGVPVQAIAEKAFYECDSLTSVTVPEGVKLIGSSAFYACRSLETVTLPDSVGIISPYAFYYCDKLTSINLPSGLTALSDYAFYACLNLPELTIPAGVTRIGDYGLYACKSLTSLDLPRGLTAIGHYALYDCVGLTSLTLPDTLQTVGDYAFYDCVGLTSLTLPKSLTSFGAGALLACRALQTVAVAPGSTAFAVRDGVLFSADGSRLVLYPMGRDGAEYAVPDGVTEIAAEAFSMCKSLTAITLPSGLVTLGDYAFAQCTGLTDMWLPDGVQSIGNDAFYACVNLTAIDLPDSVTAIGEEAFCDCLSLSHVALPASLTDLGVYAFSGCESLTAITLPKALKTVGDGAFLGCSALSAFSVEAGNTAYVAVDGVLLSADGATLCAYPAGKPDLSYTVPDPVKTIAPFALARAIELTSLTLPEGLTEIGERGLAGDALLKSLTLPASLSAVGGGAFGWCGALTAIQVADGNPNFTSVDGVLYSADATILYAYPAGKPDAAYTVAATVDSIEDGAFAGATHLKRVTVQGSASDIGAGVFDDCADDLVLYGQPGSSLALYAHNHGLSFAETNDAPAATTSQIAAEPTSATPFPWGWIGVGAGGIVLLLAGWLLACKRRLPG